MKNKELKIDLDNPASLWNGMLLHQRIAKLQVAEKQYVDAVVGTPMNRKQRRQKIKLNRKGKRK